VARWTVVELLHLIPSLLTTVAAVGFALIFGIGPGDARLWWIGAVMLLAQFSISALNEWADADLDRRAGRQRPIPLGLVSPRTALSVAVFGAVGAFLLSTLANFGTVSLLLVGVGLACGWAYDLRFKGTPLSFLPFAIAFPLMPFWIGLLAGRPASSLGILFLGGIPLATAIHLADAIPDRERDQAAGLRTLAVALGRPGGEMVAAGLLLVGTMVSIVLILRYGQTAIAAISLVTIAASLLIVSLSATMAGRSWSALLGKWLLIAAASLSAVPLVAWASGR
jgi:4-hydroxybenzoate polyprenyltransferase